MLCRRLQNPHQQGLPAKATQIHQTLQILQEIRPHRRQLQAVQTAPPRDGIESEEDESLYQQETNLRFLQAQRSYNATMPSKVGSGIPTFEYH